MLKFNESKVTTFAIREGVNLIRCPLCESANSLFNNPRDEEQEEALPTKKLDLVYPIRQIAYRTLSKRVCSSCNRPFTVDFGKSEYNIYTPYVQCTANGDVEILAKYESFSFGNYYICRAKTSSKPKYQYYIISEKDKNPIFLSRKKALEFLKDHHATLKFIKDVREARAFTGFPVYKPM